MSALTEYWVLKAWSQKWRPLRLPVKYIKFVFFSFTCVPATSHWLLMVDIPSPLHVPGSFEISRKATRHEKGFVIFQVLLIDKLLTDKSCESQKADSDGTKIWNFFRQRFEFSVPDTTRPKHLVLCQKYSRQERILESDNEPGRDKEQWSTAKTHYNFFCSAPVLLSISGAPEAQVLKVPLSGFQTTLHIWSGYR